MAQRRMFSLKVIDTDSFLDMSPTAQNLYFHLGMRADDDGFIASPKKIMKMVGAPEDDFRVLVTKGFVVPMATNGVCVISHWKMNNLIKSDRYTETIYLEEKGRLTENNGVYTVDIMGSKMVPTMEPQVRLGKDRLINTTEQSSDVEFSLKDEIKKLMDSERRELRIIGWFIHEKKVSLKNKEQLQTTIRRHLRSAKLLVPFEVPQIKNAADNADRLIGNKWTLETLYKLLTK